MSNTVTKGKRVETLARITYIGSSAGFAWEVPLIRFRLFDEAAGTFSSDEVIWCSDRAGKAAGDLRAGDEVALSGFLYGRNLRRVQLARGCSVWGIGQL